MISTLKVQTLEKEPLIEKIKPRSKNVRRLRPSWRSVRGPEGWRSTAASQLARRYHGLFEERPKQPPKLAGARQSVHLV